MLPLLISGAPGTGKSTVARYLAGITDRAVHVETDVFFAFVKNRLDPSKPESNGQNETIIKAYCSAAGTYAEGGYSVIMDGVIGPWTFPLVHECLGAFDYVVLTAPLAVTLKRMAERPGQASATPSMARRMYPKFAEIAAAFPAHVIDTESTPVGAVADAIERARDGGALTVRG